MLRANTIIKEEYFFKSFTWNIANHTSTGFALSKDKMYFYESDDMLKNPMLVDEYSISKQQVKKIKKYLYSYKDVFNDTKQYFRIGQEPCIYNLKGYYRNKLTGKDVFVNKVVIGDIATTKLVNAIFKILNNEEIQDGDYIS